MNQNKTVGIVIPIYNVENYLRECIESVINQTYLNLEIILVNDGSTDKNSLNIAKEYTLKDERITLFHKKNGGLSSARNVGIEYFSGEYKFINKNQIFQKNTLIEFSVNGNNHYEIHSVYKSYKYFDSEKDLINFTNANIDYIIFLDSDDYWRLNCIEECVSRMNGVEVLWFDYDMFFEQTGEKKYYSTLYTFQLLQEKIITPLEWLKHGITYNSFYNKSKTFAFAWQGMIDFKFLKSIKLKFINGIIFEDVAFGIILFASLKYIYIYPEIMLTYRVRDNSIMQSLNKNTLPFYASYLREYFADEMIAKNYHIILSEILILEELTNFVILFKNTEISHLIPIFFFEYFINKGIGIFNFNNDPMKLEQRFLKTLYTLLNFNTCYIQKLLLNDIALQEQFGYYSAKQRIKNQLSYKLGQSLIINSKNFFSIVLIPIYLLSVVIFYKQEQKISKDKIKKLPPIESCLDYKEAMAIKNHLSYKLGQILIKNCKNWYKGGLFKLPFDIIKTYKIHKKKRAL